MNGKKEMLKEMMDLLYKTANADNDAWMFYYETGNTRYVAGRGDVDKFFDMAHFCIDEAIRAQGDE